MSRKNVLSGMQGFVMIERALKITKKCACRKAMSRHFTLFYGQIVNADYYLGVLKLFMGEYCSGSTTMHRGTKMYRTARTPSLFA